MKRTGDDLPEVLLEQMAAATESRVASQCRHFGQCGGCQLQDIPYDAQVTSKRAMLMRTLQSAGIRDVPAMEMHTAHPWGYRNRIRIRVEGEGVGYSRRASHEFLPVEECPIASPRLMQTALAMRDLVREGSAVWPERTASLELFADAEERFMQLAVHLDCTVHDVDREAPAQFRAMCERVKGSSPELVGAGLLVAAPDPQQSKRVQSTQRVEIARWGVSAMQYTVAGRSYRITRNAFFQVNRFLTGEMVATVVDHRSGERATDLFAGAGLFSVPLSERFARVTAVEIGEPAASDLRENLAACGSQHRAIHSTAETFLQRETQRTELVVMDPPRAGVSLPALRLLGRIHPEEIVYVSCDPATFARDAKTLLESGYTFAALHLFDLFPHTFHTETIAVFRG